MGARHFKQNPTTGRMEGAYGGPGETPPTAALQIPTQQSGAPTSTPRGPSLNDVYAAYQQRTATPPPAAQSTLANSTAPKGTDAPPLTVAVRGGARLYVPNPADADWAAENPDEALAQGRAFPSVTTCMGTLDKPALMPWASKMAATEGETKLQQVSDMLQSGDTDAAMQQLDTWLRRDSRTGRTTAGTEMSNAYRAKRDSSSARGTDVHALVEAIARGDNPTIPDGYQGYVDAYRKFREDFPEIEYVAEEVMLLNREGGYAGTADVIAKIGDKYYVLDYKTNTNGAVYDSVGLQLAALAKADTVMHPDGSQSPAPHISGGIGIGLSPEGQYTATPFRPDDYFDAFAGAAKVWRSKWARRTKKLVKASSVDDILANT